jgi:hypothetical protein
MARLAAIFGGLTGLLLPFLALVAPTAWLLLPAHLLFSGLVCLASIGEGLSSRPERARRWGLGYLVSTLLAIGAFDLGARVADRAYWLVPWTILLAWGWIPPVVAGLAGWGGDGLRAWRSGRAVRRRHRARISRETG